MIVHGTCFQYLRDQSADGLHAFATDAFKLALYFADADVNRETIVDYTTDRELTGAGYTAGGYDATFTEIWTPGTRPQWDLADIVVNNATWGDPGALAMLLYNTSKSNRAVTVFRFGTPVIASNSEFTIKFPDPLSGKAILRATG